MRKRERYHTFYFLNAGMGLLMVSLMGCAPAKLELKKVPFDGKSWLQANEEQVITLLEKSGNLLGKKNTQFESEGTVIVGKNDDRYLLRQGNVIAILRSPDFKRGEQNLSYWHQLFSDQLGFEKKLEKSPWSIRVSQMDEQKAFGVVFDSNSKQVMRVIEYETR